MEYVYVVIEYTGTLKRQPDRSEIVGVFKNLDTARFEACRQFRGKDNDFDIKNLAGTLSYAGRYGNQYIDVQITKERLD